VNVTELVEVLEGIEVPMFAEVYIVERESDGPLRVVLDGEAVTITNDSSYPGEQLWPRA
jgi:hypothetical protein